MTLLKRKGFTIVELVVVIAVIAILASVLMPVFNHLIHSAKHSSALSEAKSTLGALNADYIATHEGSPLPDGVVLESGGFCFVFLQGALYEIVPACEMNLGDATVKLWLAPGVSPETEAVSLALAAFDETFSSPVTVCMDETERECLDIGFVECEEGGGVFTFLKAEDAPFYRAGDCGAFFGMMLSTLPSENGKAPKGEGRSEGEGEGKSESETPPAVPTYAVTVNVPDTCGFDGQDVCAPDGDYSLVLTPASHHVLKGRPEVRIGGAVIETFLWHEDDLTLVIPAEALCGDVEITAATEGKSHALNVGADGILPGAWPKTARYGETLSLAFAPDETHCLLGALVKVAVDGVFLADDAYFWNETEGALTLPGERITGDISITVHAETEKYTLILSSNDGPAAFKYENGEAIPGESKIDAGKDFTFTITLNSAHNIDSENSYIECADHYWFFYAGSNDNVTFSGSKASGFTVTIAAKFITGDIYIFLGLG